MFPEPKTFVWDETKVPVGKIVKVLWFGGYRRAVEAISASMVVDIDISEIF